MDIRQLSPDMAVAGQVSPADVPAIAAAGFRSMICNRPDNEGGPDQPSFAQIEAAAAPLGVVLRYVPVVSGQITEHDVQAFQAATHDLPKPILAYCRSGARSTNMWALARSLDEASGKAG